MDETMLSTNAGVCSIGELVLLVLEEMQVLAVIVDCGTWSDA